MPRAEPSSAAARGESTPRTPRSRDLGPRERLLAVADDLFYQRGIRNVGIDEIIASAGVAKASLYSHFDSKDALIAEYVRGRGERWWEWFQQAVEARATAPRQRLLAVFDVLGEWLSQDDFRGCALQNACVEIADATHAAHRIASTDKRALRAYITDRAKKAGAHDARALAGQLFLVFEGAIMTALIEGSAESARAARAAAAALVRDHCATN